MASRSELEAFFIWLKYISYCLYNRNIYHQHGTKENELPYEYGQISPYLFIYLFCINSKILSITNF